MTVHCPSCSRPVESGDLESSPYCPSCGAEVVHKPDEIISMGEGDTLPGGVIIKSYLGIINNWLIYAGRNDAGQKLRIKEHISGSDTAGNAYSRFALGNVPLLPKLYSYFSLGNRVYIIDEWVSWETHYFSGMYTVGELVEKMQAVLERLINIHERQWSVWRLIRHGVFLNDDLQPAIGKAGEVERLGVPASELPACYSYAGFIPPVTGPFLDLLSLVECIWSVLGVDDSWEEIWTRACGEGSKSKRRNIFYRSLCFSPRVVEWPPLGEILSDFLSDPGIWYAGDLLNRLTAAVPARKMEVEAVSHRGLVRGNNEDAVLANTYQVWLEGIPANVLLLVLADGMGGGGSGEIAAKLAVREVDARIHDYISGGGFLLTANHLKRAVEAANKVVYEAAKKERSGRDMGTTIVAALVIGNRYIVSWVGDSRCYKIDSEGNCAQITEDHTMVANLVKAGTITKEQAAVHPMASKLSRSLGLKEHLEVDTLSGLLDGGESLLLISDGFNDAIDEFVFPEGSTAKEGLEALTVRMLKKGGDDNASAVMLRLNS